MGHTATTDNAVQKHYRNDCRGSIRMVPLQRPMTDLLDLFVMLHYNRRY